MEPNMDFPDLDFSDRSFLVQTMDEYAAALGEEALKTIKAEHVPRLIRIFQQWKAGTDFKALRIAAMKECPGLTQIWDEPFQALYTVADGEIVIRFRQNNDAVEVAADHLTKAK